jgi:hypothetical protein
MPMDYQQQQQVEKEVDRIATDAATKWCAAVGIDADGGWGGMRDALQQLDPLSIVPDDLPPEQVLRIARFHIARHIQDKMHGALAKSVGAQHAKMAAESADTISRGKAEVEER